MSLKSVTVQTKEKPESFISFLRRDLIKNRWIYGMLLPVLLYYIIFHYAPMYGAIISFKNFSPGLGIWDSPWVGLRHFKDFFGSVYFGRIFKNTITISFTGILFGFPAPIILALLLNELWSKKFTRVVQTVTYLPHFISVVVICGMVKSFTNDTGLINDIIVLFGGSRKTLLNDPNLFVPIYIISGLWQQLGWSAIIYIAALSGIDPQLYEAAKIDGAGKFRQTFSITLPGILPTIMIMLILEIGAVMSVSSEKILLLYHPTIYKTSDVISTYIYRKGIQETNYSYSTAVGLFNSVVNFTLLVCSNKISKMATGSSLW